MVKSINLKLTPEAKYICSWNGNSIVQLHTSDTLYKEYKETNLFDENIDSYFECLGNGFDNFIMKDYLEHSGTDSDFIDVKFYNDNMIITRVA
jgi:hypothetical protein